ncbi:F-box/kelch-repeat protein SKIP25 [Sesamum alatum]|uniref:F-box/kelch-repeat protein SKIP25 n=1 Tax=Sesamum alatum TaxID=300844 RepID=A0AAE1YT16_9LAMI|nr:F-box/kelch-repeat protein SKIP25 [Sesamum alatum]
MSLLSEAFKTNSTPTSKLPLSPQMSNPSSASASASASASSSATGVQSLRPHDHQEAEEHRHSLLPGLPDHIAQLCLSLVPPSALFSICHSWRRLIHSPSFPPFLSLYALFLPTSIQPHLSDSNSIHFSSFDPILRKWLPLPHPPPPRRFLCRHPSFISRKFPIQAVVVSGNLIVLAATADHFRPALSQPLVFNSLSQKWTHGPPLSAPRRWCVAGTCRGVVYVASGMGSHYDNDVARSVEKWDLNVQLHHQHRRLWRWEKMESLWDCKFSREAIDAVGWKGKLCMVNVKGAAAKEGIIYDVERESWEEMPEGMLAGWRGPAAAMEEETLYVVDESKGWLKKYDQVKDEWVGVMESEMLKGAQQVAAAGGRVCVLCGDGGGIAVVDVAAVPPARLWMVEAPSGVQAIGIHILPRLSHLDN